MSEDDGWGALHPRLRNQIDELLRTRRDFQAVVLLRHGDVLDPAPGLVETQDMLARRRSELNRQGLIEPEPPPPTTAQLIELASAITAPVVAVEALWDGDTQGWYVVLVAIVLRPGRRHDRFDEVQLTWFRYGGDIRLFTGSVPPWPEQQRATEQGVAVARHLGVPFHFTSPDEPDVDLPRWWDTQP